MRIYISRRKSPQAFASGLWPVAPPPELHSESERREEIHHRSGYHCEKVSSNRRMRLPHGDNYVIGHSLSNRTYFLERGSRFFFPLVSRIWLFFTASG
jgi:hypothetical protein